VKNYAIFQNSAMNSLDRCNRHNCLFLILINCNG